MTRPPRLATILVSLVLDGTDRPHVLADLAEEYDELRTAEGRSRADCWYWSQVRRSLGPSLYRRLSRPRRLPALPRPQLPAVESSWQDLRFAQRSFVRAPGFSLVAIITLALGIGANTATFSLVNSTLLTPLPFKEADRLVELWTEGDEMGVRVTTTPTREMLQAWLESAESFERLVLYNERRVTHTGRGEPEVLEAALTTPGLMSTFGVTPALGRGFLPEDTTAGSQPVALLSEGFWRLHFGADPAALGRTITLDETTYAVVGVVPDRLGRLFGSRFLVGDPKQVWLPLSLDSALSREGTPFVLARLRPGTTVSAAKAELDVIQSRIIGAGLADEQWTPVVQAPNERGNRRLRTGLWMLFAAVGFVLLIVCANLANMLIGRGVERSHEFATRAALGAGRTRVARQLLTEGLLLSLVGGTLGVMLAWWCLDFVTVFAATDLRELRAVRLDAMALAFTFALTLITSLVFVLAPAAQLNSFDIAHLLSQGGRTRTPGAGRSLLRQSLVAIQVALALVLFLGAGLLLGSFLRLNRVDPGFDPDGLLALELALPDTRYPDTVSQRDLFEEVAGRMGNVPGVSSVALSRFVPPDVGWLFGNIVVEGREGEPTNASPLMAGNFVSPVYFRTIGAALHEGRTFTAADEGSELHPVIVNHAFSRSLWPDGGALGQRVRMESPFGSEEIPEWRTIVGVMQDIKAFGLGDEENRLQMYFPFGDRGADRGMVIVRIIGDPAQVVPMLKEQVWAIDPHLPIERAASVTQLLSDNIARPRFNTLVVSSFALLALLLAVIGVYGVVSLSVGQRTREIGVRVALGAQRRDVRRLVLGHGVRPVLVGVAVGLLAAFALTRFLESLLFGITPNDPVTFVTTATVLAAVGSAACYLPARRAMSVDPVQVLRGE